MIVDSDGAVLASVTVGGKGSVELLAGAARSEGRYRLLGTTEAFGAAAIDIVSMIWTPVRARGSVPVSVSTVPDDGAKSLAPTLVPLRPRVVEITPSQLGGATLMVPQP